MEEPGDIHEFHIIPMFEDQSKHWRNENCWCEPKEGHPDEYPDIKMMMEAEDEDYIILVHSITH